MGLSIAEIAGHDKRVEKDQQSHVFSRLAVIFPLKALMLFVNNLLIQGHSARFLFIRVNKNEYPIY
jgi:hypothetical protein